MKAVLSVIGVALVATGVVPVLTGMGGSADHALAASSRIAATTPEFYPLKTGDVRRYRLKYALATVDGLVQTVGDPLLMEGIRVFPLITRGPNGEVARVDYFGIDAGNNLRCAGYDVTTPIQTGSIRWSPPFLLPIQAAAGEQQTQTAQVEGTGAFAAVKSVSGTVRLTAPEAVNVPAGTFTDVVQVTADVTSRNAEGNIINTGTYSVVLAPGVGHIKVVTPNGVTSELTGANVGGKPIP
jgi:hypothetical protein